MNSLGNRHFSSHLNLSRVFISHDANKCILLEKCRTISSSGCSGMGDTTELSQSALSGVLRLPQLASSSPGLWKLQPWVWSLNLKSCFLAIFKQSMKLKVENLTKWPPATNPAQWVVYCRLCKELFFTLKNPFQYFSSKDCTSQRDFLFICLGSSFLWEKNLWLI